MSESREENPAGNPQHGGPESSTPVSAEPETPNAADAGAHDLQADLEKFRDLAMRTAADLENYRKRAIREKEEAIRYANLSLLERLLPVVDNFDLGLQAAGQASDAQGILQGMSMVKKQLEDFLRESGLQPVDAEGQPFDPNLHDAIGQEASAEVAEGHVLRQIRKGYQLRDRLVRPATVIVSKGNAPS